MTTVSCRRHIPVISDGGLFGICLRHDTVAVRLTPSNRLYYEECSRYLNFEYKMTNGDAHLSRAA